MICSYDLVLTERLTHSVFVVLTFDMTHSFYLVLSIGLTHSFKVVLSVDSFIQGGAFYLFDLLLHMILFPRLARPATSRLECSEEVCILCSFLIWTTYHTFTAIPPCCATARGTRYPTSSFVYLTSGSLAVFTNHNILPTLCIWHSRRVWFALLVLILSLSMAYSFPVVLVGRCGSSSVVRFGAHMEYD